MEAARASRKGVPKKTVLAANRLSNVRSQHIKRSNGRIRGVRVLAPVRKSRAINSPLRRKKREKGRPQTIAKKGLRERETGGGGGKVL